MNLTEKAAYIKGLAEGLDIDVTTKEGKIIGALIDLVEDLTFSAGELEGRIDELSAHVDSVDEDLYALEDAFAQCCDDCDCDCCDDDEDDELDGDIYEVQCPKCGETIFLDESVIEMGSMDCPRCKELLEFELDEDEEEEEDDD